MKLNIRDLREVYKAGIKDKIPQTRTSCPSPKKMLHIFRGNIRQKKKIKIVDHITNCYYCSQEFEFIVQALRYEKKMNKIAEELITKKVEEHASKHKIINSSSPLLKWGYVTLIASCFLALSMTAIFIVFPRIEKSKYRGFSFDKVELVKPRKKIITKLTQAFEWKAVQGADYYVFELFDETLYPIWISDKIIINSIILPREISSRLEGNKSYYWMVTAFFQRGTKKESILKEFQLKE
jgi:hypothetical protein